MRTLRLCAVLLIVAAVLGACSKKNDSPTVSAGSSGSGSAGKTVTLTAKNFSFDQTALTGASGDKVTFVLHNTDGTEHNLTIKDLGIDANAEAGKDSKPATVTLKAGTFEFHCEYHPDKMKGTLTVS